MIIVIGLPKSGTTSFNYLFQQLGYEGILYEYLNNEWISKYI